MGVGFASFHGSTSADSGERGVMGRCLHLMFSYEFSANVQQNILAPKIARLFDLPFTCWPSSLFGIFS